MVGIADVAALAGVSNATVSRALRASTEVAADTREAVERAAAELGYIGSPIAAALARGRTHTIGVLGTWVSRWFFSAAVEGVREAVAGQGYDLLVYPVSVGPEPTLLSNIDSVTKRVDGVLRINVPPELRPVTGHDARIPLVTLGCRVDGIAGVHLDDVKVGYVATTHLLELGHRRIAFLGLDPADIYGFKAAADRYTGFCRALSQLGLTPDPLLVKTTGFTIQGGEAAFEQLLTDVAGNRSHLPTAIVAVSDEVAMGVMHAARQSGVHVPAELSVIGVDDHDMAYLFDLTTVRQPIREQGRVAATMLLKQVHGAQRPGRLLKGFQPELVRRHTTAPPRD